MRRLALLAVVFLAVAGCGTLADPRALIPLRPVVVWVDSRTGCEYYRVGPGGEFLMPVPDGRGGHLCREVPLQPKPAPGEAP